MTLYEEAFLKAVVLPVGSGLVAKAAGASTKNAVIVGASVFAGMVILNQITKADAAPPEPTT